MKTSRLKTLDGKRLATPALKQPHRIMDLAALMQANNMAQKLTILNKTESTSSEVHEETAEVRSETKHQTDTAMCYTGEMPRG